MGNIELLRRRMIESAKRKVKEKYSGGEVHIIKAVNIIQDLDPIANLLSEQLREWHGVHFPELGEIVKDNHDYAKLVYNAVLRKEFTEQKIRGTIKSSETAGKILLAAQKSIGSGITEKDAEEMKALALNCANLLEEREYLTRYLEENMATELPNFTQLAGPVIGAKMLAKVGSRKRLAFLPASALQVIGAEKALFLHFRKGVKGPKYGYIFQHPIVKAAKAEHKGRIARTLAAKLSIAARMDYFGGKKNAVELRKEVEDRANRLRAIKKEKPKSEKHSSKPRQPEHYMGRQKNMFGNKHRKKNFKKYKKFEKPKNKGKSKKHAKKYK